MSLGKSDFQFCFFLYRQTRNHHFKIFVNPVGVDAVVAPTNVRCVAGGYVWNPFYTQLADPLNVSKHLRLLWLMHNIYIHSISQEDLYREECGPDNPLRCYVGDVSSRVGVIGELTYTNSTKYSNHNTEKSSFA